MHLEFLLLSSLCLCSCATAADFGTIRLSVTWGVPSTLSINDLLITKVLRANRDERARSSPVGPCRFDSSATTTVELLRDAVYWSATDAKINMTSFHTTSADDEIVMGRSNTLRYSVPDTSEQRHYSDGLWRNYTIQNYAFGTFDVYCTRESSVPVMRNLSFIIDMLPIPRRLSSLALTTLSVPDDDAAVLDDATARVLLYDGGNDGVGSTITVVERIPPSGAWLCAGEPPAITGDVGCVLRTVPGSEPLSAALGLRVDPDPGTLVDPPLEQLPAYRRAVIAVGSIALASVFAAMDPSSPPHSLPLWSLSSRASRADWTAGPSSLARLMVQPFTPDTIIVLDRSNADADPKTRFVPLRSFSWAVAGRQTADYYSPAQMNYTLTCVAARPAPPQGRGGESAPRSESSLIGISEGPGVWSLTQSFVSAADCTLDATLSWDGQQRIPSAITQTPPTALTIIPLDALDCTCQSLELEPDLSVVPLLHLGVEPGRWGAADTTDTTVRFLRSSDRKFRDRGGILFTPTAASASAIATCKLRDRLDRRVAGAVMDWQEEPVLTQMPGQWFELQPTVDALPGLRIAHADDQLFCVWHRPLRRCLRSSDTFRPSDLLLAAFGSVALELAEGGAVAAATWNRLAALPEGRLKYTVGATDDPLCMVSMRIRAPVVPQRPTIRCTFTSSPSMSGGYSSSQRYVGLSPFGCEHSGDELNPEIGGRTALDVLTTIIRLSPLESDGGIELIRQVLRRFGDWQAPGLATGDSSSSSMLSPLFYAIAQLSQPVPAATVESSDGGLVEVMLFGKGAPPASCLLREGDSVCSSDQARLEELVAKLHVGSVNVSTAEALAFVGQRLYIAFKMMTRVLLFRNATHDIVIETRFNDLGDAPELRVGGLACTPPLSRGHFRTPDSTAVVTYEELYGQLSANLDARTDIYGKTIHLTLLGGSEGRATRVRLGSASSGRVTVLDRYFSVPPESWSVLGSSDSTADYKLVRCASVIYQPPRMECFKDPSKFAYCPRTLADQVVFVSSDGTGVLSNAAIVHLNVEVLTHGTFTYSTDEAPVLSWSTAFLLINIIFFAVTFIGLVQRRRNRELFLRQQRVPAVDLNLDDEDAAVEPHTAVDVR